MFTSVCASRGLALYSRAMGVIRVLPPTLVNRIAAGECVERPASVVKELMENALDAGAARVDVQIVDGGRELIQVSDDGVGMAADDLRLAVEPHATSKIQNDDDLFNIHTMGFRGEALASVGAVARLTITSQPREGADIGHSITVDGGELRGPTPCAAAPGTRVEVRDLFYCVPARRKFLRTTQTEMGQITEQFARVALANPSVAFSLRHGGRVFHQLAAVESSLARIRDFYGEDLAKVLLPIERHSDALRVEGFAAPPKESRGAGKWEYLFVNGRFIRDRFVSHAIKEAYRSLIDPSRYPVVFLFLTIDPAGVDVNVSPTKIEVRWRDSNYVHAQVLAALRDKFLSTNLDHRLSTAAGGQDAYRARVRDAMIDFFTHVKPAAERGAVNSATAEPLRATPHDRVGERDESLFRRDSNEALLATEPPRFPADMPVGKSGASDTAPAYASDREDAPPAAVEPDIAPAFTPNGRAVQIHNMYIVAQTDEGLMIIDQHALHERILYEELAARIARRPLESRRLLLPDMVPAPADRLAALEANGDTLARLGIELIQSGPQTVSVLAFPTFLERLDRVEFVRDLLDLLSEQGARPSPETLLHKALDMMACKAAVKFGDTLTSDEIDALLQRRTLAERSSHCPHGRPTTLHLSLRELEKQFKRR